LSARCQLTGRAPSFGKSASRSHRRTSRRFNPDIRVRCYWLPSEQRYVRLTLSTTAIKAIDRTGIEKAVVIIRARGGKV